MAHFANGVQLCSLKAGAPAALNAGLVPPLTTGKSACLAAPSHPDHQLDSDLLKTPNPTAFRIYGLGLGLFRILGLGLLRI